MNVKRTVVKSAFLAALAVGAVLPARLFAEPVKMRVGTYNIRCITEKDEGERSWSDRRNDFFAHVRKLDLDVFGLQEVTAGQYREIEKEFSDYAFAGRFREAKDFVGEAVPVYYRKSRFDLEKSGTFWLSETPDEPGSKSWGTAFPRVCTYVILKDKASGRRFCFANAHTDHVSEEAREKGMLLVVERMKKFGEGAPIVFVGDHNCRETEAPAKAVSQILKDAIYVTKTPPKGPWRTCTGWRWRDREVSAVDMLKLPANVRNARKGSPNADKATNGGYEWVDCGSKIDYIYVSPDITVETYETFADPRPGKKCYHSDHFPIAADIALFGDDVSKTTFAATVWRGETAYIELKVESEKLKVERCEKNGVSVTPGYYEEVAYEMQPGGVDIRKRPDVYREWGTGNGEPVTGKVPTVCKITASADAKPGLYNFGSLAVTVVDRVLPPAKDWKYFLDLWQHPWAVSRYFKVEPFSKEHYAKMEPIYRALAECGCKALTTTLLDLPWNHQCYDGYYSMIGRVKKSDGSWVFDYKLFDEYVEFGRKCGLGPDIACYTMCPWKYMATWREEGTGNGERGMVERREKLLPGTKEFEDYWGPFLVDFAAHLKEKGWFADTYIAMDERGPEDVRKIVDLIKAKAPGMKVAICGKTKPSAFAGIQIENFCQGFIHLRDSFLPELAPRRAKGYKTTFYVCCSAKHPNTFFESPGDESYYLGAYPVMVGFDGFLRWAANSWGEDPYKDGSFRTKDWKAGDVFLIYPNGELSSRLIELRAGIVAAEKMTILRTTGEKGESLEKRIADIAKRYHFFHSVRDPNFDFAGFRREVESLVNDPADAK